MVRGCGADMRNLEVFEAVMIRGKHWEAVEDYGSRLRIDRVRGT